MSAPGRRANIRRSIVSREATRWTAKAVARFGVDTDTAIARDLGVSISAVGHHRRALGIALAPATNFTGRTWTPSEDRLLGKVSDPEAARKIGISRWTVERRRLALGIPAGDVRKRGERSNPRDLAGARYFKERRAGATIRAIARSYGIDRSTVSRALRRYEARLRERQLRARRPRGARGRA
jgi:hypothetical protein